MLYNIDCIIFKRVTTLFKYHIMQRIKDIQNISEINDLVVYHFHVLHSLRRVLDRFNMSSITRIFSSIKSKGINANELFKMLFMFPFLSINNPNIPWRSVMKSFTNQFFK